MARGVGAPGYRAGVAAVDMPLGPYLTTLIEHALTQFADRNARVPGSVTVHGMRPTLFFGVPVPGLRCHTAVGGWEWMRLRPVAEPVNCQHCLHGMPVADPGGAVQLRFPLPR